LLRVPPDRPIRWSWWRRRVISESQHFHRRNLLAVPGEESSTDERVGDRLLTTEKALLYKKGFVVPREDPRLDVEALKESE
jgi:hypothetical protein